MLGVVMNPVTAEKGGFVCSKDVERCFARRGRRGLIPSAVTDIPHTCGVEQT